MNLHVFNPEHDIALAYNRPHLTMPHAAQELRMNLGWIPALWADDGDVVVVEDVEYAVKAAARFKDVIHEVLFLSWEEIAGLPCNGIQPWGWDLTLRTRFAEAGTNSDNLPSNEQLDVFRNLSSRVQTSHLLEELRLGREKLTCGCAVYATDVDLVRELLGDWGTIVVKAPWSSSGRGIMYVDNGVTPSVEGFIHNTIRVQGGVMVEPYYNKVKDFGMEFYAHADGVVSYEGLSLFQTVHGFYTGNVLASEEEKLYMLSKYVDAAFLHEIRDALCSLFTKWLLGRYVGPCGVDMMIVASDNGNGFLIHPCVEVNLRRTMGHVALALSPLHGLTPVRLMQVVHDVNYKLKIVNYENNYVQSY